MAVTRHRVRLACLVAGLTLLVGSVRTQEITEVTQATTPTSPRYLHVDITGEFVTLKVREVTIRTLLEDIAHETGLALVLNDPLTERITLELDRLRFPEAIGRVLHGKNFALQFTQPSSGTLWVFFDRSEEGQSSSQFHVAQPVSAETDADADSTAFPTDETMGPLSIALADDDVKVRLEAVSALADFGNDQATAALAAALGDEESSVRLEAVDALGGIGSETAVRILEQALLDPDTEVRAAAIEAFTEIGGTESARALVVALNDEDPELREDAVDALGEIGGVTAVRLLQQALGDQQNEIREAAAEVLSELSGREE